MQYMLLIYAAESTTPQPGTPEFGPYIQGYSEFSERVKADGVFVAGDALADVNTATTVTMENGSAETMDGPFAETREQLGGYYLLDCESLDDAIKYAAMIPTATHGRIEIRPIMIYN